MEMNGTKQIPILHVYSTDNSESKGFLVYENLSQVCSMEKDKPKRIPVDKSSTEESKSECVHKSVNKEKDSNN